MRFRSCAWLCRANDPGPFSAVGTTLAVARKPSPSKREGGWPLGQTDEGALVARIPPPKLRAASRSPVGAGENTRPT